MIVSHRHRFIFVKLRKTAGTSIEVLLSRVCGPDDIITPINPNVESHTPQNDEGFFNHMAAAEIREALGTETWDGYTKFTFERNPWDKVVSYYWYLSDRGHRFRGFRDFVLQCRAQPQFPRNLGSDVDSYHVDDQLAVDFIGRYERLSEDLESVASRAGFELVGDLPHAKGDLRPDQRHYSAYYDDETRAIVAEAYAREIDLLDYDFEAREEPEAASGEDTSVSPAHWRSTPRNAPCPCGSGKRYKHCHGALA